MYEKVRHHACGFTPAAPTSPLERLATRQVGGAFHGLSGAWDTPPASVVAPGPAHFEGTAPTPMPCHVGCPHLPRWLSTPATLAVHTCHHERRPADFCAHSRGHCRSQTMPLGCFSPSAARARCAASAPIS
eukprot:365640-Chlamydomonas_euryale.AAC.8